MIRRRLSRLMKVYIKDCLTFAAATVGYSQRPVLALCLLQIAAGVITAAIWATYRSALRACADATVGLPVSNQPLAEQEHER